MIPGSGRRPASKDREAGVTGEVTVGLPAILELRWCAHGVTIGRRCRHCAGGWATPRADAVDPDRISRTRMTDPVTSKLAGTKAGRSAKLDALETIIAKRGPLTYDAMHLLYRTEVVRTTPNNVRTMRHALAEAGRIKVVGIGTSALGNRARLWAVV